jgi:alpha-glucosidase
MEREHYKYWHKMVAELDAAGINLGLYLNPMIEEIPVHLRSGRRYLFGEALKQGYFVKSRHVEGKKEKSSRGNAALDGDMYQMNKRSCPRVGMLDVTSYQASQWWKKVIQTEVMDYAGASFWMADMGESAPIVNSIYHKQSENGLSFHNAYSEEWARVNREAIRDAGREGDSFFLVKAGYGHTPRYAGSTTLGDQVVNYKNKDGGGLQSVLNGILNGGFSGYTFGHCAVSMAVPRTINSVDERVREMICRWMEMNAFTALFRTHDSDDGVNAVSAYNNRLLLRALAKWSAVYASLADYRMRLSSEASYRGWPIARHPILHFPNDPEFMKSSVSSFMLGESMYIAPVMRYGLTKVKVYLPQGEWTHLWVSVAAAYFYLLKFMALCSHLFVSLCSRVRVL